MLTILYKMPWAFDYHIAILVDEPISYVRSRLIQLTQSGIIERTCIAHGPACNYITHAGIAELGLTQRNVRVPSLYTFEHTLGEVDLYTWLCLPRDRTTIQLADICTERDIAAAREMIPTGKSGKVVSADQGIHRPDGYVILGEKVVALEVERVLKSKRSRTQLSDNIGCNHQRFHKQIWAYEKAAVHRALEEQRQIYGTELILLDMEKVRKDIDSYLENSPKELSQKTGRIRKDLIGEIKETTPLNQLPIINGNEQIALEL